jgi:HTH-type transcriptional regulator, sugar sensing transcriptional regulator
MYMKLEKDLVKIGLSEKEAKVYLAALELGPTNILNLAKKSAIKRSTVYEMIKNLKEMGLMSETIKGKRSLIVADEPEKLKRNIVEKEILLKQILPELKTINNVGFTKPKITYYEGKVGLREIYKIALEAKDKKADWISPIKSVTETVGEDFLNEYIETKKRMGYWIRSIHIIARQVDTYKYLDPKTYEATLRKVRFAPKDIDIPNAIVIWDNKVAVMSTKKEGFGFIIESDEYSTTMKIFYNLLWQASKPYYEIFSTINKHL